MSAHDVLLEIGRTSSTPVQQSFVPTVRLVLADSHPIVLQGMEYLFSTEPDLRVVATCTDGDQALEAVRRHQPDVLVLELRMMGELNGLAVLRELQKEQLATRPVLVTGNLSENELLEGLRLGVKGVVLKQLPARLLVQCIRKVHSGGTWLEKDTASRAVDQMLRRESGSRRMAQLLTPREIEIVRSVAAGFRNREIGKRLQIAEGTVKTHLHNIFEKLLVRSRLELILYARDKGLI